MRVESLPPRDTVTGRGSGRGDTRAGEMLLLPRTIRTSPPRTIILKSGRLDRAPRSPGSGSLDLRSSRRAKIGSGGAALGPFPAGTRAGKIAEELRSDGLTRALSP